jgi:uncharacterized membrane protein YfcA
MKALTPNTNAVTATTLGTASATVLVWLLQEFAGITPTPEVAIALGVIIGAFIGHFVGFNEGEKNATTTDDPATDSQ